MSFDDEIRQELSRTLEPLAPTLVKELKDLILRPVDESAYLISFEVQPSSFVVRFPVRWDWMESDLGQLEGGNLLTGSEPLLRREHYEKDDPFPIALPILVDWFAERWHEAGGPEYRLPAYIECKGGEEMFNLKEQRWVDKSAAYPDL